MELHSWYRLNFGEVVVHRAWNLERSGLVNHCFTTRVGGFSLPPRDTLNLGLHVGDDWDHVIGNRQRIAEALEFDENAITAAQQIHSNKVSVVTSAEVGRGAVSFDDVMPGVDALITNVPGPVLALFYADCVPVFILDPTSPAIGLAHAGWRGTAEGVVEETIRAMEREFGTEPRDCIAAIGPAIGRCCYDVSYDVADKVLAAVGDDRVTARASQDQWRLDLKLANWIALRNAGVLEHNIAVSKHCTVCNPDEFFSYRRDGETGRMAAILALRQ